ncbi:hypothetical protein LSH36_963g00035, partial [Paralvinella palmiformis]
VKEVFSLFDRDNDGAIICRDVISVLRSVGHNPTEDQVKDLIKVYDSEGEGVIEFPTFLEIMNNVRHEDDTEEDIEEAFRVFDPSGSGYISAVKLREKLTEEEVEDMIAYADRCCDGDINYREFIDVLLNDGDWP